MVTFVMVPLLNPKVAHLVLIAACKGRLNAQLVLLVTILTASLNSANHLHLATILIMVRSCSVKRVPIVIGASLNVKFVLQVSYVRELET